MVKGKRLPSKPTVAESVRIGSSRTRCPGALRTLFLLVFLYVSPADAQQSLIVERIDVDGNATIADDLILGLIETRTDRFLRPRFWQRSRMNSAVWRTDLTAIESFYRNSGFLDARVRYVSDRFEADRVVLRIVIDEGPRYTVRAVNMNGFGYLSEDEIRQQLITREGQVFYRLTAQTDKRYIQRLADRRALLDVVVDYKYVVHKEDHSVTVNFRIFEGHPVSVGAIQVRGLQKTHRNVVIRELEIQPGELYDNAKISLSQTRLFQTGLFRSVRLSPMRSDTSATVRDLVVEVTELPGGEVSFGAGFATAERFRGSFSVAYRNLLGRGITIGANGQISSLIQHVESGVTQPWLFRTRTTGILRAFFLREDRISHTEQEAGVSVAVNRELSRTYRSQLTYTLKNIEVSSLSDELSELLRSGSEADSLRSRREGSLTGLLTYDTRDDILNPKTGFYGQFQSSVASPLLGSSTLNRNSILTVRAIARKYLSIPNAPDFATAVSIAYVKALNENRVPLDSRLFIGGDRSVRGFGINRIGQPDGGLIAISAQHEIQFPFSRFDLAVFADWGGVGKTLGSFGFGDLLLGYGAGVRVSSPIGLIRGDVGFHNQSKIDPPNSRKYDRTFFYFGLGQAF